MFAIAAGIVALIFGIVLYAGLATALTSIFFYFDVEGWRVFGGAGFAMGFLFGFLNAEDTGLKGAIAWSVFLAVEGIVPWQLRPDGIVYCAVLAGVFSWLTRKW